MLADDQTMWAWVSAPAAPAPGRAGLRSRLEAQPGLRVALGARPSGWPVSGPGSGRRPRARRLAETTNGAGAQLVMFDEVAMAALLTDHPDDLRNWTQRVLGGLAAGDANSAELRDDGAGVPPAGRELHRGGRPPPPAQEHRALPGEEGRAAPGPAPGRGPPRRGGRPPGLRRPRCWVPVTNGP